MVLGTASHVGKSTIVAALCRSLVNRGYRIAPFKSQNMSLNSFVTRDGCEIGIAQAMQAKAAKLEPDADMNPVLLKPKGGTVSQVILLGHPYKDVAISAYYQETDYLLGIAVESANRLLEKYGHIVVEGAGGAAEVNLYSRDIANIQLAKSLKLPILLVADIERGGVFASIYGTLQLLPPEVRDLVKGIIINKFRGDPGIFFPGIGIIEELTGVPVLGVVPFCDIPLPSEDSLSLGDKTASGHPVSIAILRLPHISNFTDFELLEQYAAVHYVLPGKPLDGYDCIILPGTKNTIEDLTELHRSGAAGKLSRARKAGIPIIGICGGYQMLGQELHDSGIESREGIYPGLGFLNGVTKFTSYEKTTSQVRHRASTVPPILSRIGEVNGYEIHMGITDKGDDREAFDNEGAVSTDGLVIGTYMHGFLSDPVVLNALLSYLYEKKGEPFLLLKETGGADPYDQLALHFERHVDMKKVIGIFEDQEKNPR